MNKRRAFRPVLDGALEPRVVQSQVAPGAEFGAAHVAELRAASYEAARQRTAQYREARFRIAKQYLTAQDNKSVTQVVSDFWGGLFGHKEHPHISDKVIARARRNH